MSLKAIVLDMDGTLLSSQKDMLDETKQKLLEMQQKGVKVILASGRPDEGMKPFAKSLQLPEHESFFISFNGGRVTEAKTDEIIFNESLQPGLAKEILTHLKKYEVIPMIVDETNTYLLVENVYNCIVNWEGKKTNVIEYESRATGYLLKEERNLAEHATYELNKVLLAGDSDYLTKIHDEIAAPFKDKANCMFTAPVYFEFVNKEVDKAHALEAVIKNLGISREEIIAFGDSQNDLEMIKFAGIGVAMGNASEQVKQAADYITKTNDENGIVDALEHFSDQF